jgi:hypothetical protein
LLYDGPKPPAVLPAVTASDEPERSIRFVFVGGCRDGDAFEGVLANPFYWESDHGRVGARFQVASDAAIDAMLQGEPTGPILKHEYEIVENRLESGIRHVRAEFRAKSK